MDCNLPGSSVHGILQARMLEWVAISYFRGSSPPGDGTQVFYIAGRFFTVWATGEAQCLYSSVNILTVLHSILKIGQDRKFYMMCILPQFKKIQMQNYKTSNIFIMVYYVVIK